MQEAIRGGATDEEIRAAGERAALEFRQESELIKRSKNMQGDAQTRCAAFAAMTLKLSARCSQSHMDYTFAPAVLLFYTFARPIPTRIEHIVSETA
eukprot:scaffold181941_cov21-Tisochrysis_lutea.AAC.1